MCAVGEGGFKLRLFGLGEIPQISTICLISRECPRPGAKLVHLKHPGTCPAQKDTLLDMSSAGAVDTRSAAGSSGCLTHVESMQ
jgi:hypothetical protein